MNTKRWLLLMLTLVLALPVACKSGGSSGDLFDQEGQDVDTSDPDGDLAEDDVDLEEDSDSSEVNEDADSVEVVELPDWPTDIALIDLDANGYGSLATTFEGGQTFTDISWARAPEVGCWSDPLRDEFYLANHKSFAISAPLEGWYDITVTVTPGEGNPEVNPYLVQMGPYQRDVAPFTDPVAFCHSPVQIAGPGEVDSASLRVYGGTHNIFIGVANRGRFNGDDDGAFTVEVQATPVTEMCYAELERPSKWAPHVELIELDEDGAAAFTSTLADAYPVCELDFLESQFCVPATQFEYYDNNHKFFALDSALPAQTYMTLTVTPNPGVDINLYGAWMATDSYYLPPNFLPGGCDASLTPALWLPGDPQPSPITNPGEAESISFWTSTNPYNYFFAVSAPPGVDLDEAGFTVSIETLSTQTNFCDESDYTQAVGTEAWPAGVTLIDVSGGYAELRGDLNNGETLCTMDWADNSSTACFPSPQFPHFRGNHEFFAINPPPPAGSNVYFEVTPDPGVDVNIYGYQIGYTNFRKPPNLPGAIACEASYPATLSGDPNPNATESIAFYNPTDNTYNYFLGVATEEGNTYAGGYTIRVTVEEPPPPHCPESLPGAVYPTWPDVVTLVELDDQGHGTAAGDLSTGSCVNLDFAAFSSVACFPATQNDHFEGNHVFFALDEPIPPHSELTITMTPASGVEANLYGYQIGETNFRLPPNVPSVIACEESFEYNGTNPGEAESITFQNPTDSNSYNIFFAVAGDNLTGTSGAFDIELELATAVVHCEESLPGVSGLTDWPDNVSILSLNAENEYQGSASLDSGACTNLDFAANSSVACFPATQFDKYNGNQVFFALDEPMPPNSVLTISVIPEAGTDVSIYGYQAASNSYSVPPAVASVLSCEESLSYGAPNPGEAETISFYNPTGNSYNTFFAVAGVDGLTTGDFDIHIHQVVGTTHCEESLPGSPWDAWPGTVQLVELEDGAASFTGDLSEGSCVNLGFASNSSVACFPATMDSYFDGNNVFYAIKDPIPAGLAVDISVTATGGEDIAFYAYAIGTNSFYVPPYVPNTVACEYQHRDRAGDSVHFENVNHPYNYFIAVAGEGTSGGFQVNLTTSPL